MPSTSKLVLATISSVVLSEQTHRCKNEERICFGNGNLDNQWESIANSWHSGCDAAISFRPTTPALSTITSTYDAQVCVKYASACASGTRELSSCFNGYTASADRSSCICAPKIQSIAYTCQYLGNITCQLTTAALSNLFAYSSCSNYQSVMANITAVSPRARLSDNKNLTCPRPKPARAR